MPKTTITKTTKTKIFAIITIIFLVSLSQVLTLIFSGCKGGNKDVTPFSPEAARTGTNGIILSFSKDMPPLEAYKMESFNLGILVKNDGAADITTEPIYLLISGYDQMFYTLKPTPNKDLEEKNIAFDNNGVARISNLKGKSWTSPTGETILALYTVTPKKNQKGEIELPPGEYSANFITTACYPYQTKYIGSVCIDPRENDPNRIGTPACIVQKQLPLQNGQGGPVAITKIEQDMVFPEGEPKVVFRVYLANSGGGQIIKQSAYYKDCAAKQGDFIKKDEIDVLEISATIGNENSKQKISCYLPDKEAAQDRVLISLSQENNYVVCKANVAALRAGLGEDSKDMSAYKTTLQIDMNYGYVKDITKSVRIKKMQ